jgi:uncharacterized protein (TIGR02246 family)
MIVRAVSVDPVDPSAATGAARQPHSKALEESPVNESNPRSRRSVWILAASLVLALAALPSHAATPDETAIRAQTLAWEKAYNGGDAKGVAAQYADDSLLLPPGAAGVSGKPAILTYFMQSIAESKAAGAVFVINPKTDVGVSGDIGWESGVYKVTVKGAVVETGKFLSVSRKKDGKWLYLRDTWNADAPVAAAPAAVQAPAPAPKK